jgi:uncharacterized protein
MRKVRTTVTLDEDVLRWVRVRAARQGKGDSQVIEESLRRDLGLDLLERLWDKNRLGEDDAMKLAIEAQHRTRPRRRKWLRAVLDPNVLISALLAPTGVPAALLKRWLDGDFELVVSEQLLAELRRPLTYPKLRSHISVDEAEAFIELLQRSGTIAPDATSRPRISRDPGDDYLLALARSTAAVLVSGDEDLLEVRDAPVESPRSFMSKLTPL